MPRLSRPHDTTSKAVLQTVAAYERSAREFLARWGRRRYRRPPLLRQWLSRLPKQARLLDLGCGGGQDAHDLWQQGYDVIGLDRTPALLSFARRRSRTLPLIRADLRRLPLRHRSVDGIWAEASLIHNPSAESDRSGDTGRLARSHSAWRSPRRNLHAWDEESNTQSWMDSRTLLCAMEKGRTGEGNSLSRLDRYRCKGCYRTGAQGAMDQCDGPAAHSFPGLDLHGVGDIMQRGLRHFAGFAAAFLNDFIQP